jgi:hypothetical protein
MGWEFRAWVVLPEMGQSVEVGVWRRFGQNVIVAGPRSQVLDHPSPLLCPNQIRGKPAASLSRKRAQPNLVTCFVSGDFLPRPGWVGSGPLQKNEARAPFPRSLSPRRRGAGIHCRAEAAPRPYDRHSRASGNPVRRDVDPRFRGGDDNIRWFGWTETPISARLKARPNRAKSGSVNFSRRLSRRTAVKKSERKGRRNLDTAIECGAAAMRATEMTRTAGSPVRAARLRNGIVRMAASLTPQP